MFKVGDRVRLKVRDNYGVRSGAVGIVVETHTSAFDYVVKLEDINDVDPDPVFDPIREDGTCLLFAHELEKYDEDILDVLNKFRNA